MYYLVIMQNNTTQIVYRYGNVDEALATFHNELAYRGEGRNQTVCVILDEFGSTYKRDYWIRQGSAEPDAE